MKCALMGLLFVFWESKPVATMTKHFLYSIFVNYLNLKFIFALSEGQIARNFSHPKLCARLALEHAEYFTFFHLISGCRYYLPACCQLKVTNMCMWVMGVESDRFKWLTRQPECLLMMSLSLVVINLWETNYMRPRSYANVSEKFN